MICIDCWYWISDGEPDKKSRASKFNSQSNLLILHFLILFLCSTVFNNACIKIWKENFKLFLKYIY